ncbi:hypothetical protein OJF2_04260 [Aquisphaera giovannonii]|uniref:TIGR04222 domain-containing membrane protein n=1 Tax=Aquisphaera giovannonii TaxID=406548 RepID=A0A5B9VV11_9BACT|nr:TIGR04222 domain-containing membrane protein [Aquisphaera giovannonii]QEH31959.1 hypothetical protein OJF2_04260 [Aquisphaera giovannonii]
MQWLLHNPIADMRGPSFLAFYLAVLAVACLVVRIRSRLLDPTLGREPPIVPGKLDAHEIAFLRGDTPRLLAVSVFDLERRGFLKTHLPATTGGQLRIGRADELPDCRSLPEFERELLEELKTPVEVPKLRTDRRLLRLAEAHGESLREPLEEDLLLMPAGCRAAAREFTLPAASCFALLGGYKLFLALDHGRHNVGLLVALGFFGVNAILMLGRPSRLTRMGKDYLARLKTTFDDWPAVATRPEAVKSPAAVMAVAVLGIPALVGTELENTWKPLMPRPETTGCGCAACGGAGGCSGGGGCGGGCGGCGGCGG